MNKQVKIIIEEEFITKESDERKQAFNEILIQLIRKYELQNIAWIL